LESSILLICSACKELGAEQPTYELRGNSLRVRFAALQSALVDESKAPKRQSPAQNDALDDALAHRLLDELREDPSISQSVLSDKLGLSRRALQRKMDVLKSAGRIERKGGKRFGYWEIRSEPEK